MERFNSDEVSYKMAASPLSKKNKERQYKDVEVENTDFNSIEGGRYE